jgi:hypothetical protein
MVSRTVKSSRKRNSTVLVFTPVGTARPQNALPLRLRPFIQTSQRVNDLVEPYGTLCAGAHNLKEGRESTAQASDAHEARIARFSSLVRSGAFDCRF